MIRLRILPVVLLVEIAFGVAQDRFLISIPPEQYGYIDHTGQIVIPPRFWGAGEFREGLAPVFDHDTKAWGYVDNEGKSIIPPQFFEAGSFNEGIAVVKLPFDKDGYAFIDKAGHIVGRSSQRTQMQEGRMPILIGRKWGYVDREFKLVIPAIYDYAMQFSEGLASVRIGNQCGFIDSDGNMRIALQPLKFAGGFHDGLADVEINNGWGYIDRTGKLAIPATFKAIGIFDENVAFAKPAGTEKWGLIDKTGKFVAPPTWAELNSPAKGVVNPFSEGLASVRTESNSPAGYVDRKGQRVIPPHYLIAFPFYDGLARVVTEDRRPCYITHEDKRVWCGEQLPERR